MTSIRLTLALAAILSAAPASAQTCEVRGSDISVGKIRIVPEGVFPFVVSVSGADVVARPRRLGGSHPVEVRSSLFFEGDSSRVAFSLARPVETGYGMVTLSTAAALREIRARRRGIAVTAILPPDISVSRLFVPCDAVTLEAAPEAPRAAPPTAGDGTIWIPRGGALTFLSAPGRGHGIRVRVDRDYHLPMRRLGRRRGWFHLVHQTYDGSRIEGWVASQAVRLMPLIGGSCCGGGLGRAGCGRAGIRAPGLYRGPAQIRSGAPVYAVRGRGRWATFEAPEAEIVEHVLGDDWVRVRTVHGITEEGMCGQLAHAWVRLADVTIPENAVRSAGTRLDTRAASVIVVENRLASPNRSYRSSVDPSSTSSAQ